MEALGYITYLAVILLIGIMCTIISNKVKIPNILLLLFTGIVIGHLHLANVLLVEFPHIFLTSISILALVMVIFDSSSRFRIKEFNAFSLKALKLTLIFLLMNMLLLSFFTRILFGISSIFLVLIFAALMSGTDPVAVLSMLGKSKNKVLEFLEIESLLNTPLVVLIPFIILDLMKSFESGIMLSAFLQQILPFLQQFVAGIGSGILVGIIALKIMKKAYSEMLSPLAVITSALLAYILAENLGGNGVLAVTSIGLLFGNFYVKEKFQLREFSSIFANSLEILVFILLGSIIRIPLTFEFFIKSLSLFMIYVIIRFLAITISLKNLNYSLKEKIFMSLNVQKGIAVAVVAFTFITLNIADMGMILNLTLAFVIYSIFVSTVIEKLSRYFLKSGVKDD